MREFSYECEIGFENDGRKSLVTKEYLHSKKIAEFHISLPHGASEVGVDRRDRYINIIYTLTWGGNKGYKYFERWRLITDPGMNAFCLCEGWPCWCRS